MSSFEGFDTSEDSLLQLQHRILLRFHHNLPNFMFAILIGIKAYIFCFSWLGMVSSVTSTLLTNQYQEPIAACHRRTCTCQGECLLWFRCNLLLSHAPTNQLSAATLMRLPLPRPLRRARNTREVSCGRGTLCWPRSGGQVIQATRLSKTYCSKTSGVCVRTTAIVYETSSNTCASSPRTIHCIVMSMS